MLTSNWFVLSEKTTGSARGCKLITLSEVKRRRRYHGFRPWSFMYELTKGAGESCTI